jgi:protein-tyrosine kinase
MSMKDTPPDLVMRAMGRLGSKAAVSERRQEQEVKGGPETIMRAEQVLHEVPTPPKEASLHTALEEGPVVGISPAVMAANGIYALTEKSMHTVEEFRSIKRKVLSNLLSGAGGANGSRNRLVMVTSSLPGEGKTHTSINLALSLSEERDKKVLLVDADVYRHSAVDCLGIKAEKGWLDYLFDESLSLDQLILRTNIPNFSVLPAGSHAENVPELMSSKKMTLFISEIMKRHPDEIIIFDSLPCLVSNEPAILSGYVGQAVFVVAAHQTSKDKIRASLGMISGCPIISLILNKAEPILTDQFSGYGYGYGYNYKKTA